MKQVIKPLLFLVCKPLDWLIRKVRIPAGLSIFLVSMIFSGCFKHYYSTNTSNQIDSATLVKLVGSQKYFVLHDSYQNREYAMVNMKVTNDSLHTDLAEVADEYAKYQHPTGPNHNAFLVKDESYVLYEVHLYTEFPITDNQKATIPLRNVRRIDVYELDKKSTNKAKVGSIIGITLTTAGAVLLVAAIADASNNYTPAPSTTYSCSPQVLLTENQQPELQGTMYSGALYASLQRADYLPLKLTQPAGDKIMISVKGKEEEIIMLNSIQLMRVTHSEKNHVLIDRKGNVLVYNKPVAPIKSITGPEEDVNPQISTRDGKYYSFTNHAEGGNSSDIILEFKKPRGANAGKLILNAKNSPWSYYLFSQFKSLYGDYYPTMILNKDKADPKKVLQCELDQFLPLLVSIKSKDGWKFVDYFPTSGTSNSRDLIMNLDLEEFRNMEQLEVRLQTTYLFWDLDYAGMDFSTGDTYKTECIPATRSYKKNGDAEIIVVTGEENTAVEIDRGEQLNLEFNIPSSPGNGLKNSYFLAGNGYYHDFTPFAGKPQFNELSRFTGKGAFDKYSREKYDTLFNLILSNRKPALVTAK